MCNPTVTRAFGSAVRIAETICRSHSRADDRVGGITQFEFSFPRSHIQTASWPARAPAVSAANKACARAMSGSEYQFRNRASVDPAVGHHTKAIVAIRPAERPRRNPVHSAHVPGEEGGNERDAGPGGQIRHGDQPIQHAPIHLARGRLEVRPGQEEPDRVETARGNPCEIGGDLRAIEVRPPPHRRSSRPVVDAEPETLARRPGVSQRCLCRLVARDRAPRRGDRARDSRRPCGWSRSGARPRRARASCPSRRPRARAATASSSEPTRKPFTPSRTISGIDPRGWAITGVPQAIASTTLKPNGSSKLTRWRRARAPARSSPRRSGPTGPRYVTRCPSSRGSTRSLEVLVVLNDPRDDQRQISLRATSIASTVPFSGWILPKKRR